MLDTDKARLKKLVKTIKQRVKVKVVHNFDYQNEASAVWPNKGKPYILLSNKIDILDPRSIYVLCHEYGHIRDHIKRRGHRFYELRAIKAANIAEAQTTLVDFLLGFNPRFRHMYEEDKQILIELELRADTIASQTLFKFIPKNKNNISLFFKYAKLTIEAYAERFYQSEKQQSRIARDYIQRLKKELEK